jgi:Cu/Ag efflux pump CusA
MLRWVIGTSLKARLMVVALTAGLIVYGVVHLNDMPVDILPEFSQPYVEIQTEALGLSAAEVEALITVPLEADMLNGAPWLDEIRSQSIPGLSSIVLIFKPGTDLMNARQMVQERLTEVHTLPNVAKSPVMINPVSSASRVMMIGLSSEKLSLIESSVLARWTIAPRLMGVDGVANVSIWGERRRQLQVQVDPKRLQEEGVKLQQVINTTGNALWFSPLTFLNASTPGTTGFIDTPNQRLGVRHLLPITTAEELARVPLEGTTKRLGDVTNVVENHQPLIGDAIVNDEPSLVMVVEKFPWANTVEVTRGVENALEDMRPGLAGLEMDSTLFRPASYIEASTRSLSVACLIAGGLIIVALGALYMDARATLISSLCILASFLTVVVMLYVSGVAINAMVIAGLAVALGAIIGDAVLDVENVVRRLRQHLNAESRKSYARIVLDAAFEMRGPLLYATIILLLMAVPAYFLNSATGTFLQSAATAYAAALAASTLVALTLAPALGLMLMPGSPLAGHQSAIVGQIHRGYGSTLSRTLQNPRLALAAACIVALAGAVILFRLEKSSLIPTFKERDLLVEIEAAPGTSHPAMTRIASQATHELRSISGVRTVSATVGRAVMSDQVGDVNSGKLWVSVDRDADYDETVKRIRQVVDGYAGLDIDANTYLKNCVTESRLVSDNEDIVVRVYGDNWDVLRAKAEEVKNAIAEIDGITQPEVELPIEEAQLEIEVDMAAAEASGLKPGDLRRAAATLLSGIEVGYLFEKQKVFDVVVWGVPETRANLSTIRDLLIDAPNGEHVQLKDVANLRIVPSPTVIEREGVARFIGVSANVRGRDVAVVAADVEHRLLEVDFPLEYRAELHRGSGERFAKRHRTISSTIAAVVGILLVLQACVGSWRLAMALAVTLPAAAAGSAVAALALGEGFSLGVLLGLVAVMGVAVRSALVLIAHIRRLSGENGVVEPGGPELDATFDEEQAERVSPAVAAELVHRGAWERFTPILMTAVITALAVLPLVFIGDGPGGEILYPMSIVVLGGLVTAMWYAVIAAPAMYVLFPPARGTDLDDLMIKPAAEIERQEAQAPSFASDGRLQTTAVNN